MTSARALWACVTLALFCTVSPVAAVTCTQEKIKRATYTLCEVLLEEDVLRLWLWDESRTPFSHFANLQDHLDGQDRSLTFAMNAGMYHPDRAPVGHYREAGVTYRRVITSAGPGNFGLLPNGVFCISRSGYRVIESRSYRDTAPQCDHATQSGPMLVVGGTFHPALLPKGTSRYIRNGVGTSADGRRAVFVISDQRVNFYDFASVFRDHLGLENALYFDGNVSRIYAPDLDRQDTGLAMGPIVGTFARRTP